MKVLRFLTFLFLLAFGGALFILQTGGPTGDQFLPIEIRISSGESVQDVAAKLKDLGVIRSTTAFKLYLKSKDIDTKIQPGSFTFTKGASFAEIADQLMEEGKKELTITIPEGYTIAQIDLLLTKEGLIESGELTECAKKRCDFSTFEDFLPAAYSGPSGRLEGYLFPDTYFVDSTDFVPKFFLERMLGTFRKRVVNGMNADIETSGRSLHEIVTMASLIERETRTNDERPMVSGILWKRFDADQGLAVDATVRYALNKITEPLTRDDLATTSPFNTRKYRGLPPGPIANSGLESIRAALQSKESPYWYYLHGRDGQIRYSETNDEHNEKKARYL